MGTCVEVTGMWVNLLPIEIMQNEPIMKVITFVSAYKLRIESLIFAAFAISAIVGVVDDFRVGMACVFTTIILTVPFPMLYVTMLSAKLYEKMVPDNNVSGISFFKVLGKDTYDPLSLSDSPLTTLCSSLRSS